MWYTSSLRKETTKMKIKERFEEAVAEGQAEIERRREWNAWTESQYRAWDSGQSFDQPEPPPPTNMPGLYLVASAYSGSAESYGWRRSWLFLGRGDESDLWGDSPTLRNARAYARRWAGKRRFEGISVWDAVMVAGTECMLDVPPQAEEW
jgi:hypothetical protein